jgi:DUF4097 and DUF4098 domain-containing protein YvlB
MIKAIGLIFFGAAALMAQDGVEKATVPLHDPSRPVRIRAELMAGGITVRGADVREVVVEAHTRTGEHRHESHSSRADGMKRLDMPGNAGMDIVEDDNVVNIKTATFNQPVDLVITVPRKSSLQLKCMNDGDIYAEQVDGEIDVNNLNGKITLKNVSGSVLAHSLNGEVTVTLDRIDDSKPMSFSTLNGDIDVTLPESLKANVIMKTDHGEIFSDFEVKLLPEANAVSQTKDGNGHHIHFDRSLRGTINGGGNDLQLTTFNGQIFIRKRK